MHLIECAMVNKIVFPKLCALSFKDNTHTYFIHSVIKFRCWSVLEIVPQVNTCFMYTVQENNSFHSVQEGRMENQMVCSHNLSLERYYFKLNA